MDIEHEVSIIQNLIQSGKLDEAFVEHNKLLDHRDINYENQAQISLIYSRLLLELGEYDKSHSIMFNLLEDKDRLKSEALRLAIDVYYVISEVFTGKLDEAKSHILKIEENIPKLKKINIQSSKPIISELHNIKGILNFRFGDTESAIEEYNKSINISKEIGFIKDEARTIFNMASLYDQNGDINSALSYFRKSLELFDGIKFYEGMLPTLSRLKNIYQRLGDEESIYRIDRSIMDSQLNQEIRKCKILSSRMDFELNSQITNLIEERNLMEQKVWKLEFRLNSEIGSDTDLAENIERKATEELDNIKTDTLLLSQQLDVTMTELDNVKADRDLLSKKLESINIEQYDKIKIKNEKLELELNSTREEIITLNEQKLVMTEKINSLESKNKDLEKRIEKALQKNNLLTDQVNSVDQIKSKYTIKIDTLNKNLEDLENKFTTMEKNNERLSSEIIKFEGLSSVEDQNKALERRLIELEAKNKSNEVDKSKINELNNENQLLKLELDNFKSKPVFGSKFELEALQNEFNEYKKNNLQDINNIIKTKDKEIEILSKKMKELENQVEIIPKNKDDMNNSEITEEISSDINKSLIVKPSEIAKLKRIDRNETPVSSSKVDIKLSSSTVKPSEIAKTQKLQREESPVSSSKIDILVGSSSIKPSEIAKKQKIDRDKDSDVGSPSSSKIGKVYHKNLSVNNSDLKTYLDSDKLADNIYNMIKTSGPIQLRFLAMRLASSMPKCIEIINTLEKMGTVKIQYSEGNENNPTLEFAR